MIGILGACKLRHCLETSVILPLLKSFYILHCISYFCFITLDDSKGALCDSDKIDNGQSKKEAKSERVQEDVMLMPTEDSFSAEDTVPFSMTDPQSGRDIARTEALEQCDYSTDVNMEATINPDDVV
uniref:Uncharacterized protein n=1 Tax=Chenopodium quinoa TaxID=63459 RepID=A0A803MAJ6_CHEQI